MKNKETGEQIEDNDFERIQKRMFHLRHFGTTCEHCYCKRESTSSGEHIVCCICGHKRLANPITY